MMYDIIRLFRVFLFYTCVCVLTIVPFYFTLTNGYLIVTNYYLMMGGGAWVMWNERRTCNLAIFYERNTNYRDSFTTLKGKIKDQIE